MNILFGIIPVKDFKKMKKNCKCGGKIIKIKVILGKYHNIYIYECKKCKKDWIINKEIK